MQWFGRYSMTFVNAFEMGGKLGEIVGCFWITIRRSYKTNVWDKTFNAGLENKHDYTP